jgi:hypothetical protein
MVYTNKRLDITQSEKPAHLPSGWKLQVSDDKDSKGVIYYLYSDTDQAQWEFPVLPPPWTEEISTHKNSEGKIFYYNPDTNKVQWEWPFPSSGGRRKTRKRRVSFRRRPRSGTRHKSYRVKSK